MMSSNFWYLDRDHTQRGPVGEDEFAGLIRQGVITRETQMWTAGMTAWRMAGEVPNVSALFGPPTSATMGAGTPAGPFAGGPATGPLNTAIPVWGFFWRSVVTIIGIVLIIPAPWAGPWFYKWLCERVSLPDGRPLTFSGQPGDIWYVFVGWGVLVWIGELKQGEFLGLATILLSWTLGVLLLKWVCAHASTPDERLKLSFEGGYFPCIGWNILLVLSAITIIGWAWVMKYMLRWICQNVRGTAEFAFTGIGLEILWRTIVVVLLSILIIPIPWMMRWYANWMLSQVAVRAEA
jgi:GYF domain 2